MLRSFLATLADLRKGRCADEAAKQYGDLVEAVKETGKAGKITVTLTVQPLGKDGSMQQVLDEVKLTMPKADRTPTIFFVTDDGSHSLDDPSRNTNATMRSVKDPNNGVAKEVSNG